MEVSLSYVHTIKVAREHRVTKVIRNMEMTPIRRSLSCTASHS